MFIMSVRFQFVSPYEINGIDGNNTINLKLFPIYSDPPFIHDYQVPILTVNLQNYVEKRWDLAIQRVIPP
jgi:hypothetical protein